MISVIIPSRNCLTYLKYAIQTVLSQEYENYELIVSDNHSDDGTWEYLQTIQHPHLRVMQPPRIFSMTGHYEWLLTQTKGNWITIVGSDDGVQPYFFHLADILIKIAEQQKIQVINAERAYFFWQDGLWENLQTSYAYIPSISIRNAGKEFFSTMLDAGGYFSLPQIYAGSLVHRDVIQEIKNKQNGKFYFDINPDAYGAAALASIKADYIHSHIPLIWVGTSAQSNGSGVSKKHNNDFYLQSKSDNIAPHPYLHNFKYAKIIKSITLWMWEAMLNAKQLQDASTTSFYHSKICQYIVMATILREIHSKERSKNTALYLNRKRMLYSLLRKNKIKPCIVVPLSYLLNVYKKHFFQRAFNKALRVLKLRKTYRIHTLYNTPSELKDMLEASEKVDKLASPLLQALNQHGFIKS